MTNVWSWIGLAALFGAFLLLRELLRRGIGDTGTEDERSNTAASSGSMPEVRYRAKRHLLTQAEQRFARALSQALPAGVYYCPLVRLCDILVAPAGKDWRRSMNRIQSKHLDFVLIETTTSRILAAIELDDSSHHKEKRRERDDFVEKALASAGVPLLRIRNASGYDPLMLRSSIANVLETSSWAA